MSYILIAGLPRSGSTLLQSVIFKSPKVFTLPESHYFEEAIKLTKDQNLSKNIAIELLKLLQTKWGLTLEQLIKLIELKPTDYQISKPKLYFSIIEEYRPLAGDNLVGLEKTPGNLLYIRDVLKYSTDIKIILTTRNPRDFANSIIKLYWAPDSLQGITKMWNQSMQEIFRLKNKYPDQVFVIDYDDMIKIPKQVFNKIYDFVNLNWDDANLLNLNANTDQYILSSEEQWKSENLNSPIISKKYRSISLSYKQRLLIQFLCFIPALNLGYSKYYKF